jgi:hypothetical protein
MVSLESGMRKPVVSRNRDLVDRLCGISSLFVGAGLFLSPWLMGFGSPTPNVPTQSAGVTGAFIAVLSIAVLYAYEQWEAWLIAIVAVCTLASPWIFNFGGGAMVAHLFAGAVSLLLVAIRLGLWPRVSNQRSVSG